MPYDWDMFMKGVIIIDEGQISSFDPYGWGGCFEGPTCSSFQRREVLVTGINYFSSLLLQSIITINKNEPFISVV